MFGKSLNYNRFSECKFQTKPDRPDSAIQNYKLRINSDQDKMATEIFQHLILAIQTPGLNFRMEISAFSATIHIKNSFLKDKNENPLISSQASDLSAKIKSENDVHARKVIFKKM
jgi:hypothetical protein